MEQAILGIDVAKQKLDVALLQSQKTLTKQFDNSLSGCQQLQAWLTSLHVVQVHACLEATGSYGDAVALFLHEAAHLVAVVNPFRIKGYANAKFQRNKTDIADARLMADFCLTQKPERWLPPTPAVAELQALTRRIEAVEEMLQREKNRLAVAPAKIKPSIQRMLTMFAKEIADLETSIKHHFAENAPLKEQTKLLQTIPGMGEKTASLRLAEIEFSRYHSAREVAAYAGVTPKRKTSGTSLNRTHLSKLGNGRIRKNYIFRPLSPPCITTLSKSLPSV